MTELARILHQRIAAQGPIPLSDYMADCLLHPEHGYYATRDPLGAAGDFITAPEISQMFGELLGLCLAQVWMDQGLRARPVLAELGPGRGTLMADMLRAMARVPGLDPQVHLVEASPVLRARQAELLAEVLNGQDPVWHDEPGTLPEGPLLLVANEFFDALPIRQYQRDGAGWRERLVGWEDGLTLGLGPRAPVAALSGRLEDTQDGDLVEICPAAPPIIEIIGDRITTHGGAALIIDYGDWTSLGDTLQALRGHAPADPLHKPGEADLTAHVDFAALAQAAPCAHSRLTPQGVFLERLGITARAQALAAHLKGAALETHVAAHRRLTHPSEMGNLFKVLGLMPKGAPPPPGTEP